MNHSSMRDMTKTEMTRRLQELAFAKVECELYLDAHPECMAALDYYKKLVGDYKTLAEMYENTVGPIRQENIVGDGWTWINTPWPWQMEGDEK